MQLMTSPLKTEDKTIIKSIECIYLIFAPYLQQISLVLLVSFFMASASPATNCVAQSKMTFEESSENPNSLESDEKLGSVEDQISLVDWSPIYIDNNPGASVLTLRFPIPKGLDWNTGAIEPLQSGPTPSERWMGGSAKITIGEVSFESFGRRPVWTKNPLIQSRFVDGELRGPTATHFDASFLIGKNHHLADTEIKYLQKTTSFGQHQLSKKETSLGGKCEISPVLDADGKKTESSQVLVTLNKAIFVEQVKIGNFSVDVVSNHGGSFYGRSNKRLTKSAKEISIKVRGIDQWFPLTYQMPYQNSRATVNNNQESQ